LSRENDGCGDGAEVIDVGFSRTLGPDAGTVATTYAEVAYAQEALYLSSACHSRLSFL
jgi:hypothetical protein